MIGGLAWVTAADVKVAREHRIGASACLGFVAVEPLVHWWGNRSLQGRIPDRWWMATMAGALHLSVVAITARVAGASRIPGQTMFVAPLYLFSATAAAVATGGREPQRVVESEAAPRTHTAHVGD